MPPGPIPVTLPLIISVTSRHHVAALCPLTNPGRSSACLPSRTWGLLVAGMAGVATAHSAALYLGAWTRIGVAMAMTLYEAAFATINREFIQASRKGISVLTLFSGLASIVLWPLTLKLNTLFGWRDTLLIYSAVHIAVVSGVLPCRREIESNCGGDGDCRLRSVFNPAKLHRRHGVYEAS